MLVYGLKKVDIASYQELPGGLVFLPTVDLLLNVVRKYCKFISILSLHLLKFALLHHPSSTIVF